ncbi:RNA polymerase sigma factor [Nevskia ramosa]|uniref:RNA polymerase sigma factor n=2 Tax=Nevskia TaxID=64001 RepID=UPI002357C9F3|nr:sigma-70 family RNA polymerase sigma factor [Nevskia ramosa]
MTTAILNLTMEAALPATTPVPQAEPEDHVLARRAASGDSRAFEQLYRLNVDRIYGLCLRLCHGDSSRAEQATQDAFVRAWEKLSSFRGESRFSTWMHRLTVNVVLGEHRLLRRWVTFEDEVQSGVDGQDGVDGMDAIEPLRQEDIGSRIDLERALAKLPKGARTVLMLHDIEGYQHDEISALTGIAIGTSKAQLHRARRLLQAMLS